MAFKRTQLTTDFTKEILQTGEVAFSRSEATFRLLLAAAVLQNAGSFFDDGAAFFRTCVQYRVDLTLRNDDVLLTTNTAVREQVLDVEQSTRHTIERVLAVARAEQRSGNGDLVELNRKHSRGVIDGEADLGPTECGPLGGTSKDDVIHLLRTNSGRRLGAKHPTDRVDDVGFARTIGAHHNGDAWFEIESCRIGKGLEALHRESFQIHQT